MAKIVLKGAAKIDIVAFKSCCHILVLGVMVTIRKRFLAVTNAAAAVNKCWPAVILSTGY